MADIGQDVIGTGANMVIGRGINAAAGRALPIPSFYNPNDPNHWGNSEAMQILHGNTGAMRHFAGRTAGAIAGQALIPIPFIGGMVGGWLGNKFAGLFDRSSQPTATVGGQPATTTPTSATSGDTSIDPWTGQSISSGSAGTQSPWMQPESFSNYGPYASGYQAPGQQPNQGGPTIPDFSNYSDQFTQPQQGEGAPMNHAERQDYRDNLGNNGAGVSGNYGVSNFNVGGSPVIFGDNGMDPNGRAVYNWGLPGN